MNNKILTLIIASSMVAIPAISMAEAPSSSVISSSAIPSAGNIESTASISAPTSDDTTSSAGSGSPSAGDTSSSAGAGVPSASDTSSSAGTDTTPAPATPVTITGSGGSSSGSYIGGVGTAPVTVVINSATTSCPLITSYLKFGGNNDSSQVAKLQIFLKNSQNLDVDVNGTFDIKTEAAVKAFQTKYMSDTMGPWGATQGSGFVYITTEKKINELACNSPLTLSASDSAIIDAYKNGQSNGDNTTVGVGPTVPGSIDASKTVLGPEIGSNGATSSNTASVVNASVLQRLWSFIKNIF